MIDTTEKRNNFVARYETRLGNWPGRGSPEHTRLWWRFVDGLADSVLDRLFRRVEYLRGDSRAKPNIAMFERALRDLSAEKAPRATGMPPCAYCGDKGTYAFPAIAPRKPGEPWRFDPEDGVLSWYMIPCRCTIGQELTSSSAGPSVPEEAQLEVFERMRAILGICRVPASDEPMTIQQLLACEEAQAVGSVVGFLEGEIRKSHRIHAIANGTDTTAWDKAPPIGETLAILRQKHGSLQEAMKGACEAPGVTRDGQHRSGAGTQPSPAQAPPVEGVEAEYAREERVAIQSVELEEEIGG